MVEYKGNDVHLKLLAKDDEVDERIFNIIINAGVVTMKRFLKESSKSYYEGVIQQFCAWAFGTSGLYNEIRHAVQQRRNDYNDTWKINNPWNVVELLCNEHVEDVLDVVRDYTKSLFKAPSVLRALISDLIELDPSNNDEIFVEACLKRIEKIKGIFKRLGILL